MNGTLLDLVKELNTLSDDNLAARVIANSDVQWCLEELQDILEADQHHHEGEITIEKRIADDLENWMEGKDYGKTD